MYPLIHRHTKPCSGGSPDSLLLLLRCTRNLTVALGKERELPSGNIPVSRMFHRDTSDFSFAKKYLSWTDNGVPWNIKQCSRLYFALCLLLVPCAGTGHLHLSWHGEVKCPEGIKRVSLLRKGCGFLKCCSYLPASRLHFPAFLWWAPGFSLKYFRLDAVLRLKSTACFAICSILWPDTVTNIV